MSTGRVVASGVRQRRRAMFHESVRAYLPSGPTTCEHPEAVYGKGLSPVRIQEAPKAHTK